jgi:heptosyltransferase I
MPRRVADRQNHRALRRVLDALEESLHRWHAEAKYSAHQRVISERPAIFRAMLAPRLDRTCIVMMSAAGDAVHTLPVVNAIKRHAPAAHITWVLQPGPAALVQGHRAVDEIVLFDRSRGWRAFTDIRRALASSRFDLVINLQVYFKAGIVTAFAPAPIKLGFDRARARDLNWLFTSHKIPPHANQHVQDQYFEFLRELGIAPEPVEWHLGPWPEEKPWQQQFFSAFERPAVAMVVATSKPEKDWLPERWAAVSDALWHDFSLEPVIVGGRSDRELHAERVIQQIAKHKPRSALGSGLRRLVSILDGSALAIAPDTGPLHMAVAIERPVISLMGYTNPRRTGPYRRYHDLIVDAYGDPGEDYAITMENRRDRMPRIHVRDVLDRVERWRQTYARSIGPKR